MFAVCEPSYGAQSMSVCGCAYMAMPCFLWYFLCSCNVCVGVPWREMADDGSVDDEGHDNFYYVLNNVIKGNHLPCPKSVTPLLPELPEVLMYCD